MYRQCRNAQKNLQKEFALAIKSTSAARAAGMKRGRADSILAEVAEATARWPEFADAVGVPKSLLQAEYEA